MSLTGSTVVGGCHRSEGRLHLHNDHRGRVGAGLACRQARKDDIVLADTPEGVDVCVIAALGNNQDFHRLRVGIGRGESADVAGYVLGALSAEEREFWSVDGRGSVVVLDALKKIMTSP